MLDSLANCQRQLEAQEAELLEQKAYEQDQLQERSDAAKQYELLRQVHNLLDLLVRKYTRCRSAQTRPGSWSCCGRT